MNSSEVSFAGVTWDYLADPGEFANPVCDRISGDLIKATPKRKVIRCKGRYVKEVRYRGVSSVLKSIFGGTACLEGRISLELLKKGISIPEVIAFGSERRLGLLRRDILLTREIQGGISLDRFLMTNWAEIPVREKFRITAEIATFVRQLHDQGVFHADLHIGNIIVVSEGGWKFFLLDTDRVRLGKNGLSRSDRIRNLAQLLANLWPLTSRSQRCRFIRNYGIQRDADGLQFIREIERLSRNYSHKIWKNKTGRSLKNNSRFAKDRRGRFNVYRVRSDQTEQILSELLPNPDRILEKGEIFKVGRTVRASRVVIGGRSYFLKRYNCKGWGYQLRNAFRRSRAVRTWLTSWGFRVRDLPVPQALICLEERRFRFLGSSYLLSEFIEHSLRLTDLWPTMDDRCRNVVSVRLGLLLGRMHLFGCVHGDLKWNNILLRQNANDCEIFLADLDSSRILSRISIGAAKRDIERCMRDFNSRGGARHFRRFLLRGYDKWFPQGSQKP